MSHKLITPPAIEPVTLQEIKNHLAIQHQDEDDELTLLALSAREMAERYTGRAFIAQRFSSETPLEMEHAPARSQITLPHKIVPGRVALRLTKSPLIRVEQIQIFGSESVAHDILEEKWHINTKRDPAVVMIDYWAQTNSRLKITYEVGYGARREDVPHGLRYALIALIAFLYKHRTEPPKECLMLFDPYRLRNVL